jgi:hypothetical protein
MLLSLLLPQESNEKSVRLSMRFSREKLFADEEESSPYTRHNRKREKEKERSNENLSGSASPQTPLDLTTSAPAPLSSTSISDASKRQTQKSVRQTVRRLAPQKDLPALPPSDSTPTPTPSSPSPSPLPSPSPSSLRGHFGLEKDYPEVGDIGSSSHEKEEYDEARRKEERSKLELSDGVELPDVDDKSGNQSLGGCNPMFDSVVNVVYGSSDDSDVDTGTNSSTEDD